MQQGEKCHNCLYSGYEKEGKEGEEFLHCYRYAPKPYTRGQNKTRWPAVMEDDWCGEWNPEER